MYKTGWKNCISMRFCSSSIIANPWQSINSSSIIAQLTIGQNALRTPETTPTKMQMQSAQKIDPKPMENPKNRKNLAQMTDSARSNAKFRLPTTKYVGKMPSTNAFDGRGRKNENLQKKSSEEARGNGNHPIFAMLTNAVTKSTKTNYILINRIYRPWRKWKITSNK